MEEINKNRLEYLYNKKLYSAFKIAEIYNCSPNKINYWLSKFGIPKRSISEAVYAKHNPKGDPFTIVYPTTIEDARLYGLGLGLFWGEGNKKSKSSIRLGNTDPQLILTFIKFLEKFFKIKKSKLRFGLQIFSDLPPSEAINFWKSKIKIQQSQFQKVIVTPARGNGTYKNKIPYGVLTVYLNNTKLRNLLLEMIENM